MKVVNILKDGTVVESMSNVTVPKDIVEGFIDIANRKVEIVRGKRRNGDSNTSGAINKK